MKLALAAVVLGLTIYGGTSCSGAEATDPVGEVDKVEAVTVRYLVEGTAQKVNITIETPTGGSQQHDVALPMMAADGTEGLHFKARPGQFVYIAAQNDGDAGSVVCRIEVDGVMVSENRSDGAYSIATCKGSA